MAIMDILLSMAALSLIFGLILCAVLYYVWRKSVSTRLFILFIDAPDPDNSAAAVAIIKTILSQSEILHVVLTGRPVNFRTAKLQENTASNVVNRQRWETSIPLHADLLLQDSAARISNYLSKCNVQDNTVIYDGGIAPQAPLSDMIHAWDFLFDRQDLITSDVADQGEILFPNEYQSLIKKYNQLSPNERENKLISIMRLHKLVPLRFLRKRMQRCSEIHIFLGGPATALFEVFQEIKTDCKVKTFIGMFGSNKLCTATLLNNQFNIACDIVSAKQLLLTTFLSNVSKYFITTETAKQELFIVSADELETLGINPYIIKLQRLWEFIHNNKKQPLFDIIPVMAFLPHYKNYFTWCKKAACMTAEGSLCFADSNGINTHFVSQSTFPNMNKKLFVTFLTEIWS